MTVFKVFEIGKRGRKRWEKREEKEREREGERKTEKKKRKRGREEENFMCVTNCVNSISSKKKIQESFFPTYLKGDPLLLN